MADGELPEFYVDQFRMTVGAYGIAMTLGLTPPHPAPGQGEVTRDVTRLRMSLEHAKVLAMIMKRQLKAFEEQAQVQINIPRQVYNSLGLSSEDW
jgi:hypothetical protein